MGCSYSTFRRLGRVRSGCVLAVVILGTLFLSGTCTLSRKPVAVIEDLTDALGRGDIDRAFALFSRRLIAEVGVETLKKDLSRTTVELKEHGGIKSIRVLSENEVGEARDLLVEITRGNSSITKARYRIVKEDGAWKIDAVALDASELEPLHPHTAVEDVVNWSRQTGVSSIQDWLRKQPAAVCL